jgi:hypothetical protein
MCGGEGAVLIGGSISPDEHRGMREAAAIPCNRIVYMHPQGLVAV